MKKTTNARVQSCYVTDNGKMKMMEYYSNDLDSSMETSWELTVVLISFRRLWNVLF